MKARKIIIAITLCMAPLLAFAQSGGAYTDNLTGKSVGSKTIQDLGNGMTRTINEYPLKDERGVNRIWKIQMLSQTRNSQTNSSPIITQEWNCWRDSPIPHCNPVDIRMR